MIPAEVEERRECYHVVPCCNSLPSALLALFLVQPASERHHGQLRRSACQKNPPLRPTVKCSTWSSVGGGVSGVYVAWRLQTANPSWKVAVCEMSERVGGRLYSIAPPGMPHLRAELGGMRFRNSQLLVAKLIEHLGLIVEPFPSGDTRNMLLPPRNNSPGRLEARRTGALCLDPRWASGRSRKVTGRTTAGAHRALRARCC